MIKKKYTIKDIANLAGVSKGTVDRVLHNRGKVSDKALKRVEKILKQIEYQPNPMARNLRKNKIYKICVLMPDIKQDTYWLPAYQGVCDAAKEFKAFGISVDVYFYHPQQKSSFIDKSREALATIPDVLLMAPLFDNESLLILEQCKKNNVRVACFNNYLDALSKEIFIGQDLHQSGKIAAGLIDKISPEDKRIAVVHIDWEPHMQLKEDGFKAFFKENNQEYKLLPTQKFLTDTKVSLEKQVMTFLKKNPSTTAIFVTNSKAFKLVSILSNHTSKINVIGYDLLEQNIKALKNRSIDFLIHQKPKQQAYLGVVYFAEFFLFGKRIPARKILPIDIGTSENVDYYLE